MGKPSNDGGCIEMSPAGSSLGWALTSGRQNSARLTDTTMTSSSSSSTGYKFNQYLTVTKLITSSNLCRALHLILRWL